VPVPTVNLDTRRFGDLVEEARSIIPRNSPGWTDHNVSDPGITLVELLAWLAEQGFYTANRVRAANRRKFLGLVGVIPEPPRPASAVVAFELRSGEPARTLPAGTVVAPGEPGLPCATAAPLRVTGARIAALQSFDGRRFADLTPAWRDGVSFLPLGRDPLADSQDGPAFYVGLDRPPATGETMTLWLTLEDGGKGGSPHHSARVVWEGWNGAEWARCAVDDDTRALTASGTVRILPQGQLVPASVGEVPAELRWLRARLTAGSLDAAPVARDVSVDAVEARQAVPARHTFRIAPGVAPRAGSTPATGAPTPIWFELDADDTIVDLSFEADQGLPELLVLGYRAAGAAVEGSLTVTLALAGVATGLAEQAFDLAGAPVADGELELYELAAGATRATRYEPRQDLDTAGPGDALFALDAQAGIVRFGDSVRGAVPAEGSTIVAGFGSTAAAGAARPGAGPWRLAGVDDALNAVVLGSDPAAFEAGLERISSRVAAAGSDAEELEAATGRAAEFLWAHERLIEAASAARAGTLDELPRERVDERVAPARAVTALDFERLALAVPGTRVARARAWAGTDVALPGLVAPGTVSVVIVPFLPEARPVPSEGLLAEVRRFLDGRRLLGTRLVVAGPRYVELAVSAKLRALAGTDAEELCSRAERAVADHLHPLTGGPVRRGWPFGRDVYRSELMQLLDELRGTDHVAELVLTAAAEGERCDDVCVGPNELVALTSIRVEAMG
jgi:predicted phage baseplate assembly protein